MKAMRFYNMHAVVMVFFIGSVLFSQSSVNAQGLSGPSATTINQYEDYSYTDDYLIANPVWAVTGGQVTNQWQSGLSYFITILWNTAGTGIVEFKDGDYQLGSMEVAVSSPSGPPSAPIANPAQLVHSTSFTANWSIVSGALSYRLDVSLSSTFSSFISGYNGLQTSSNNVEVLGLTPGTVYYYRVRAVNNFGSSGNSNVVSVVTKPPPPVAQPAVNGTQSSFIAKWNTTFSATSYRLDISTTEGFTSVLPAYNNLLVNGTEHSVSGLNPNTIYYYRVRAVNASGTSANSNVIAIQTANTPPVAIAASEFTTSSFRANWNSVANAGSYRLDVSAVPTFTSFISGYYNLQVNGTSQLVNGLQIGTVYYYRVRAVNSYGSTSDNSATIQALTLPATPVLNPTTDVAVTSFKINWNPVASASQYHVELSTSSQFESILQTQITSSTFLMIAGLTGGTQYYYRVRAQNTSGFSSFASGSQLTVPYAPVVKGVSSLTSDSFIANWKASKSATVYLLDVSTRSDFNTFLPNYNGFQVTDTMAVVSPLPVKETAYYYRVRAMNSSGISAYSGIIKIILDQNYVRSTELLVSGVTNESQIGSLNVNQKTVIYQFYDGLGRISQTVAQSQSPTFKDIVQPKAYDGYGREAIKYLPYTAGSDGWFKMDFIPREHPQYASAVSPQFQFYQATPKVATDSRPYSETVFENSPLNRPLKQYGPGEAWGPEGANRFNEYQYLANSHGVAAEEEKIIAWSIVGDLPVRHSSVPGFVEVNGFYSTGQLYVNVTRDEEGNAVREYTDKSGKLILKKVQALNGTVNLNNTSMWAITYYIYDHFGNLRFVLPPELSKIIHQNDSYNPTQDDLNKWAFVYKYDDRNRMIEKRIPGAQPVFLVYDNRDRLVMTQDGVQRLTNKWLFTKYDALNRPIITGIYTHGSNVTQAEMSALISTTEFFETYNGVSATHGYTNTAALFPSSNISILTVTYYDNYSFTTMVSGLGYSTNSLSVTNVNGTFTQPSSAFQRVTGQVTGTKVNILGTSNYLWAATYYDDKYRVIQTIAQNHKSGTDRVSNLYDFAGRLLQTRRTYVVNGITHYVRETFTYDHAGRLLNVKHSTNGAADVMIVKNEYNELGELVDKQLHSTDNGVTFKQSVDYRYNIRGWLTKINEPDVSTLAPGETLEDYFGMELAYNNTLPGVTATPVFNGNISAVKWSTGAAGGANKQAYHYHYDALNRLSTSGHYKEKIVLGTGPVWQNDNSHLETGFSYDLNGNILALQRRGNNASQMDNLTYHYTGNQLTYVTDTWNASTGFVDGNTGTDDYLYDANGNMTQDKNKGITAITYNHLNLPVQVNKGATDYIVYTYDATGRKLTQQVFGSAPKVTDYVGELLFEGTTPVLKQINHSEGRVLPDGANWEYQYHLKDHLGSVRATFTAKPPAPVTSTANFETSTNSAFTNYFRTSFDLVDHTDAGTTYTHVQHLNGGVNGRVGVGKSISVLPGDKVSIGAWAKYMNPGTTSNTTSFITALASAFGTSSTATGELGKLYSGLNSYATAVPNGNHPDDDETAPKAFVTILLFDKDYNLVDAAWKQITTVGLQSSPTVKQPPHDYLFKEVTVREPGFAYVFVSNEHPTYVDLYFDDVTITHTPGPLVQVDDYYPFGLTFNSYRRENSNENRYLYNQGAGKKKFNTERVFDLDLNVDLTKFRAYDPDIGRWWQIDPKADQQGQEVWSPYNYGFNNPIRYNDPEGDCIPCMVASLTAKYSALMASMQSTPAQGAMIRLATNKSNLVPTSGPDGNITSMAANKNKIMGKINDAKIVANVAAKNIKLLTNEVSKDGVSAAKAIGTGLELTGVGAPAGAAINAVASVLDEGRQVALEGKSLSDVGTDLAIKGTINAAFSGLGNAAKSTVKQAEAGKKTFDNIVDGYSFGFSNLFQWVYEKIQGNQTDKKDK